MRNGWLQHLRSSIWRLSSEGSGAEERPRTSTCGERGVGRGAPWWALACERRVGSGAQVGRRGEHLALRLEHGAVPVGRERACARRGEHMHAERTGGRLERAVVSAPW